MQSASVLHLMTGTSTPSNQPVMSPVTGSTVVTPQEMAAIDEAFSTAERVTLAGSTIPAFTRSVIWPMLAS